MAQATQVEQIDIEKLIRLSEQKTSLLADLSEQEHRLELHQFESYRWLYSGEKTLVSLLDINSPDKIISLNQQLMLVSLGLLSNEKKRLAVLNLGVGGGCFERCLYNQFDQIKCDSVELDEKTLAIARQHLFFNPNWPCHITKAEAFIQQQQANAPYQLILCDIFAASQHPECLFQSKFYLALKQQLDVKGVVAINLLPKTQQQLVEILIALRQAFDWVMLSQVSGCNNIVLLLTTEPPVSTAELKQTCRNYNSQLGFDLANLVDNFQQLPPPDPVD